ncbi:MAG: arginine repressor [Bacteroidales bacterium]|nr:arginine repressor [Bacteroidales bacterium]
MRQDKDTRLEVIKMIITSQEVGRQDDLLNELAKAGFPSTQATLSRDLRQLRIVKGHNERGEQVYLLPEQKRYQRISDTHMTVQQINRLGAVSVKFSLNLAIVQTPPGHAAHVAYDIDNAHIPEILGTIAGDDTILIVLDETAERPNVLNRLAEVVPETRKE